MGLRALMRERFFDPWLFQLAYKNLWAFIATVAAGRCRCRQRCVILLLTTPAKCQIFIQKHSVMWGADQKPRLNKSQRTVGFSRFVIHTKRGVESHSSLDWCVCVRFKCKIVDRIYNNAVILRWDFSYSRWCVAVAHQRLQSLPVSLLLCLSLSRCFFLC